MISADASSSLWFGGGVCDSLTVAMRIGLPLLDDVPVLGTAALRLAVVLAVLFSFAVAAVHIHADDNQLDHGDEVECAFCLTVAGKKWTAAPDVQTTHFLTSFDVPHIAVLQQAAGEKSLHSPGAPRAPPSPAHSC